MTVQKEIPVYAIGSEDLQAHIESLEESKEDFNLLVRYLENTRRDYGFIDDDFRRRLSARIDRYKNLISYMQADIDQLLILQGEI